MSESQGVKPPERVLRSTEGGNPDLVRQAEKRLQDAFHNVANFSFYDIDAAQRNLLEVEGRHDLLANLKANHELERRLYRESGPNALKEVQERLAEAQKSGDIDEIDRAKIEQLEVEGKLDEAEILRKDLLERTKSG